MFEKIKERFIKRIVDEVKETLPEADVSVNIGDEEMLLARVKKANARLTKLQVQIKRLEEKKELAEKIDDVPGAWLLRLRDKVEDELIMAERNQVEADRKAAQEKFNLINLILNYAKGNRGKNS